MTKRFNSEIFLYFVSVFLFSWAFWVPAAWYMNGMSIQELTTSPVFILLQTLGAAGPSVMAYIFLRYNRGKEAVREITKRYKIWRIHKKWYLLAIFLIPGLSLLALFVHHQYVEPVYLEGHALFDMFRELRWGVFLIFPLIFAAQIFTSPLLEEFGWRGYAQPLLQTDFSVLQSSLIIGFVWGCWHLPLVMAYNDHIIIIILTAICHSVIIGWILNSTKGSMLIVLLFHASLNVALNILSPTHDSLILFGFTAVVTGVIIYQMKSNNLKPFDNSFLSG